MHKFVGFSGLVPVPSSVHKFVGFSYLGPDPEVCRSLLFLGASRMFLRVPNSMGAPRARRPFKDLKGNQMYRTDYMNHEIWYHQGASGVDVHADVSLL